VSAVSSSRVAGPELYPVDSYGKPLLADAPAVYLFGSLIRETELALLRLFSQGQLSGTTHTCLGQELCQMSVVRVLDNPADVVLSNHRNHGHFLTYTGDFHGLVAEIMGREGGVCGGVGGSQHLAWGNFHSNGVQGGMAGIAAGHGLAARMRGGRGIVAVMIGDGTLGQGLVYEALNLISVWALPVLFVVENNGIAQTTPTAKTVAGSIPFRAAAFGVESWRLDDSSPDFLRDVETVVQCMRVKRRPGLLVIDSQRLGPHSKGDDLRSAAEISAIRARDPLQRLGARLPGPVREACAAKAREHILSICELVEASPRALTLHAPKSIFVFPPEAGQTCTPKSADAAVNVRASLNTALRRLLEDRPEVVLLGEDLHDPYGGAFKVTAGLSSAFPDRVLSTPISEAGVVGAAIGLALEGFRPIVEIMFADFLTLAMDQIYNHAVKFPGMFPHARVPLLIRTPSGGRRGYGPTHSQSPESLMCGVPGLTVVFPSARHDPGALLETAVTRWLYPVVFFEHKLLYGEPVAQGSYRLAEASPDDPAAGLFPTLVSGSDAPDVTLVAYGGAVKLAEEVAQQLEREELEVGIVVPSLLAPLCRNTLLRLLSARERIVVIEEAVPHCGFGAELAAVLVESGFRGLYRRVGAASVPIPAGRTLEEQVLPQAADVIVAVLQVLGLN
jgi:2-oxoisovalerate dehydrogenase E1 component